MKLITINKEEIDVNVEKHIARVKTMQGEEYSIETKGRIIPTSDSFVKYKGHDLFYARMDNKNLMIRTTKKNKKGGFIKINVNHITSILDEASDSLIYKVYRVTKKFIGIPYSQYLEFEKGAV